MGTRAYSPNLTKLYKYKYKAILPTASKKRPADITVKPVDDTAHFADTYQITVHYLERYIERIYKSNPKDYTFDDLERLAEMLRSILPLAEGLSTTYTHDGITSIIKRGIAITVYPEVKEDTNEN